MYTCNAQNFTLQQLIYWTMLCCDAMKYVGKYCIEQSRNTSDRRFDYIPSGFRTSFGGGMQSRKALLGNTQHKKQHQRASTSFQCYCRWMNTAATVIRTAQGGIFMSDQTATPFTRSWKAGTKFHVGFQVLLAMSMKSFVFWNVATYISVQVSRECNASIFSAMFTACLA